MTEEEYQAFLQDIEDKAKLLVGTVQHTAVEDQYEVGSLSRPDEVYVVTLDTVTCTCPKWQRMMKEQGKCQHIRAAEMYRGGP